MKRILLQKIVQHDTTCYQGKIDPRILVKIATEVAVGEVQDAQRPLALKKMKEICKHVGNKGILPNTLTIATNTDKLKINKLDSEYVEELYYIDIPTEADEISMLANSIDVMDGQHRLYSFAQKESEIGKDDKYEMGFILYETPTLDLRRKIFVICNEKQDKVSPNLLMWLRDKLKMLNSGEKDLYYITGKLAESYPLKGHIIMGAEKITNGCKAKEIMADLKKIDILSFSISQDMVLTNDQIIDVLTKYFSAWQKVVGFEFSTSTPKEAGVAVKMAGMKYMIYVLKAVWDHSFTTKQKFNVEFCEKTLKQMISELGVPCEEIFTDKVLNKYFQDRTQITALAEKSKEIIKKLGAQGFNPLD